MFQSVHKTLRDSAPAMKGGVMGHICCFQSLYHIDETQLSLEFWSRTGGGALMQNS